MMIRLFAPLLFLATLAACSSPVVILDPGAPSPSVDAPALDEPGELNSVAAVPPPAEARHDLPEGTVLGGDSHCVEDDDCVGFATTCDPRKRCYRGGCISGMPEPYGSHIAFVYPSGCRAFGCAGLWDYGGIVLPEGTPCGEGGACQAPGVCVVAPTPPPPPPPPPIKIKPPVCVNCFQ